ncbi:MAG: hypothetical protein GX678_01235, partial [Actinomycetales bacterium]|nr:hypothetical protein [Actinomycetales bacterium]
SAIRCTESTIRDLKNVLIQHPGVAKVNLRLVSSNSSKMMSIDNSLRVSQSSALIADLKELLGPGCVT